MANASASARFATNDRLAAIVDHLVEQPAHARADEMRGLGPNGSGKTTLLRLLAGLRRPDAGTVHYDGTNLRDFTRRRLARRLAVVEQDTSTSDNLTVRQVVELGRTPFRGRFDALTDADEQIIDAALERTDIADNSTRVGTRSPEERSNAPSSPAPWLNSRERSCWTNPPTTSTSATSSNCSSCFVLSTSPA